MPTDLTTRKEALSQAADQYRQAIDSQIVELKQDAVDVAKKVAIIGGTCLAVYLLVDYLTDDSTPKPKRRKRVGTDVAIVPVQEAAPEKEGNSVFWSALKGVAVSLALALAKEKITELIANLTEPNAETNA